MRKLVPSGSPLISRLSILGLVLGIGPEAALADPSAAWAPNDISVAQSVPGLPGSASTHFEIGAKGDARIAVDLRDGGRRTTGTILLIGGRWMLTQGFTGAAGREIEALDVAALNSQLVIVLLTAALPNGRPAPGAPQHVRFAEKANSIRIATASRSAEYLAPWTVVGVVRVTGADAPATYQLSFTCSAAGLARTMEFTGSVGNAEPPIDFPDSMKLAGWHIRRLPSSQQPSPTREQPDSGVRDASPGPAADQAVAKAATLGELRLLE